MRAAIKYCREHDILKEFLENNATEVLNMLLDEYDVEDAMDLREKLGLKKGLKQGLEQGLKQGLEQGRKQGFERERRQSIRNMLVAGMTPEQIAQTLKLPLDEVLQYLSE
jgi:hypothetical protein